MPPKKDKKPRRPRARATGGGRARAAVKHEHVHHYEPMMHARQPALFMNTPSVEELLAVIISKRKPRYLGIF